MLGLVAAIAILVGAVATIELLGQRLETAGLPGEEVAVLTRRGPVEVGGSIGLAVISNEVVDAAVPM